MKKPFSYNDLSANVKCACGCGKAIKKNLIFRKSPTLVAPKLLSYKCWLKKEIRRDGRSRAFVEKARREISREGGEK